MVVKKKSEISKDGFPLAAGFIAGVAGTYFLYGKNAASSRKKIKGWVIKAKGEAIEKMEKMKELDEEAYHMLIDTVVQKYSKIKGIEQSEVDDVVKELKKHWKSIMKDTAPKTKKKPIKKAKGVPSLLS